MRRPRAEEGSSLVEVVIALGILLILMIGILQMFSMAYLTNLNSAVSTELAYKAQQTAEVLRWALYQEAAGHNIGSGTYALPAASLAVGGHIVPDTNSSPEWSFWGPSGVGIQRQQNPAYEIIYTITEDAANYMATVQVRARVRGHRYGLNDTVVYTGMGYAGAAGKGKVVTYVVRAPKAVP